MRIIAAGAAYCGWYLRIIIVTTRLRTGVQDFDSLQSSENQNECKRIHQITLNINPVETPWKHTHIACQAFQPLNTLRTRAPSKGAAESCTRARCLYMGAGGRRLVDACDDALSRKRGAEGSSIQANTSSEALSEIEPAPLPPMPPRPMPMVRDRDGRTAQGCVRVTV